MFDPKKPFNDLPPLPPGVNFDDIDVLKAVNEANKHLAELNGLRFAIPNMALVMRPLSIKEAVASSGIENINTTVAEVYQAQLFPESQRGKAQKETLYYLDAVLAGWKIVEEKKFLATNDYLSIQHELEPSKPGVRKLPGTKITNDVTGEVYYTPPEGEGLIRDLLSNFEKYYNDFSHSIDPLIVAAVAHYQFEAIHPFYDGNGRTGRILLVLQLVLAEVLVMPVLYISGFINENRSEYYRLLRGMPTKENWKEWVLFLVSGFGTQAKNTTRTITAIRGLMEEYQKILQSKSPLLARTNILEYLFTSPFIDTAGLMKHLKISRPTAVGYLRILEKDCGVLKTKTVKKRKMYFSERFLDLLTA